MGLMKIVSVTFALLVLVIARGHLGRFPSLAFRAGEFPSRANPSSRVDEVSATLDELVKETFGVHSDSYDYNTANSERTAAKASASLNDADEFPVSDFPPSNMIDAQSAATVTTTASTKQQNFNSPSPFPYNEDDLSQVDKDLIFEGLKELYRKKVLPLEIASKYSHFASPPMGPSDFDAKPMVLILGQYSVGKTSFIRSLLQQDFPGQRIGPEPTTDRFTAIMHTDHQHQNARLLPGHALVMQASKPFRGLASYGNNFLSKFEGAEVCAPILRNITIVDTPGVLAGEKQRLGRDYDFSEVVKWFAERADMIIIMFDAHKLDISDELRTVLETLKPHQPKIRVLLNKADTVDTQALLRVYGALMWALGKVVQTPEVVRVYLGSFWGAPLKLEDNRALLEREKADLLQEMMSLPQSAVVRRINELVKRARSVKVHAYIIHYLKKQMPYVIGKSEKQRRLLDRLDREFVACARRYNLPIGDFPNVDLYRKMLREIKDISDFKRLDKNLVYEMDRVLTHDIPLLLQKATANSPRNALNSDTPGFRTSLSSSGGSGGSVGGAGGGGSSGYSIYNPFRLLSSTASSTDGSTGSGASHGDVSGYNLDAAASASAASNVDVANTGYDRQQQLPRQQAQQLPPQLSPSVLQRTERSNSQYRRR